MLLFTFVYKKEREDIIDGIKSIKEYFSKKDIVVGVSENMEKETHFIKLYGDENNLDAEFDYIFKRFISLILLKVLIKEYYKKGFKKFIDNMYFFLNPQDVKEIRVKTFDFFIDDSVDKEIYSIYSINKKNLLINKIKKCVEENAQYFNVEGFITFRMKQLEKHIEEIIDKTTEKYMVEKEYDEFIKLLKYFVEIEESKIDEVSIVIDEEGKYTLRDSEDNDLTSRIYIDSDDIKYMEDVSKDDILISWLITNVPKHIKIVNIQNSNNKELFKTIKKVFEDKIELIYCKSNNMYHN